ncbi:MAG: hypothetical protein ACOYLK_03050 [Sphingomonas sp.]
MTTDSRPSAAAIARGDKSAEPNVDVDIIGGQRGPWARVLEASVGVLAAVLLAVFAIAPPARPLGADSFLISSPQSIGGRS